MAGAGLEARAVLPRHEESRLLVQAKPLCFGSMAEEFRAVRDDPIGHLRAAIPGKPISEFSGLFDGTRSVTADKVTLGYNGSDVEVLSYTSIGYDENGKPYALGGYWTLVNDKGNLVPVEENALSDEDFDRFMDSDDPYWRNWAIQKGHSHSVSDIIIPATAELVVKAVSQEWYNHLDLRY